MRRLTIFSALATAFGIATTSATSFDVGDVATAGQAVPLGTIGPDGSNGGLITYAFFSAADTYTNTSGGPQLLQVTEANFNAVTPGTLTPFVAILLGGGAAGGDYNVLSVADGIAGVVGLNNASFLVGGSNPTITLNNGETLVAGFYQSAAMIPWENGDADYLSNQGVGGNTIPAGGTGALVADANWSTLGRDYSFNVGLDVVPEPSISFLLLLPASFAAMIYRRRRKI